jgi:hypothetical protein
MECPTQRYSQVGCRESRGKRVRHAPAYSPFNGFVSRHDRLARKTGRASQNFSANALNHYEVPMVTPTPRPRPDATVFEIAFVHA